MKKKIIFLGFICPLLLLPLYSFPALDDYLINLDDDDKADLLEEGNISRSNEKGPAMLWLPDHPLAWELESEFHDMEPGLAVEIISFIPMDHGSREDLMVDVMNRFLAVSEQKGITYYSSSRKKEMTLIEDSYAVSKVGNRKAVDDPKYEKSTGSLEAIIYQKDSSFGGNYFLYESRLFQDGAYMTTTNKSKMNVMGFFTVARPEENIMAYVLLPVEEGLFIYTAVLVKDPPTQKRIMGVPVYIEGFFKKRVNKIVEWFARGFIP